MVGLKCSTADRYRAIRSSCIDAPQAQARNVSNQHSLTQPLDCGVCRSWLLEARVTLGWGKDQANSRSDETEAVSDVRPVCSGCESINVSCRYVQWMYQHMMQFLTMSRYCHVPCAREHHEAEARPVEARLRSSLV